MKLLFYDLETTGLGERAGIVEIAAILIDLDIDNNVKLLDSIDLKMCPIAGKIVESTALQKNNLSIEKIKKFPNNAVVFNQFIDFLNKNCDKFNQNDKLTLCGYNNLHFDNDFLRNWFKENNDNFFGSYFFNSSIDVMSNASQYWMHYRPAFINFKLETIAKSFNINLEENNFHNGLYDIKITLKIFLKILKDRPIKKFDQKLATAMYLNMLELKKLPREEKQETVFYTI
jgi:DNA polymerase III epsilon subunit-like protein